MVVLSQDEDRRKQRRYMVSLPGKILSADGAVLNCTVVDLSLNGAAIKCGQVPVDDDVVLCLDHIGRVRSVCTRYKNGILSVTFSCPEVTRQNIAMWLGRLLESGAAKATRMRREDRVATANFQFTRANGEEVFCDALDISLRGISLRTDVRPPIGELVVVGRSQGRVVRHHKNGIGVQFLALDAAAAQIASYRPAQTASSLVDNVI